MRNRKPKTTHAKKRHVPPGVDFDSYLQKKLKNPEFRRGYEEAGRRILLQLELSSRIKELRKKEGLTQAAIASRLNTSVSVISRIESEEYFPSLTINTLHEFIYACGYEMKIKFQKISSKYKMGKGGKKTTAVTVRQPGRSKARSKKSAR